MLLGFERHSKFIGYIAKYITLLLWKITKNIYVYKKKINASLSLRYPGDILYNNFDLCLQNFENTCS